MIKIARPKNSKQQFWDIGHDDFDLLPRRSDFGWGRIVAALLSCLDAAADRGRPVW